MPTVSRRIAGLAIGHRMLCGRRMGLLRTRPYRQRPLRDELAGVKLTACGFWLLGRTVVAFLRLRAGFGVDSAQPRPIQ